MPDDSAETDRIDQLTDRIDRLESVAQAQQATIEELRDSSLLGQWGRRGVLGSVAAALGLSAAPGSASAGVGDLGTPSERVDVVGDQGEFNTLEADKADTRGGYQVVTSSRSFNTSETNNSGSDMDLSVTIKSSSDNTRVGLFIDVDSTVASQIERKSVPSGGQIQISATIPAGSNYELGAFGDTADFFINQWREQT